MPNWILRKVREEAKVVSDCQVLNCFPAFGLGCYLCIHFFATEKEDIFLVIMVVLPRVLNLYAHVNVPYTVREFGRRAISYSETALCRVLLQRPLLDPPCAGDICVGRMIMPHSQVRTQI